MKTGVITAIRQFKSLYLYLLITVFFLSCGSRQDIVYFQNVDDVGSSKSINTYSPTIKPDDMLTITVSALDQDAARPFNLPMVAFTGAGTDIGGRATQQSYLVDTNGNIDFPVLGKLKLAGLTRIQATDLIRDMLNDYIKNPIVNIRTINFRFTVLGAVNRASTYTVQNERITILEALGLAGDINIQARRDNILVVRESEGKKTYNRVDLTSEDLFNSPVYYLTQNDVIYVEPNNAVIKSSAVGPNFNATLGVVGTLATIAALIVSITR